MADVDYTEIFVKTAATVAATAVVGYITSRIDAMDKESPSSTSSKDMSSSVALMIATGTAGYVLATTPASSKFA